MTTRPDLEAPSPEDAGRPVTLTETVTRVLAPNPNIMTGPGTNTYVVGAGPVVVIDPGPDDDSHVDAVEQAVGDRDVKAILLTHDHADHSQGVPKFREHFGAPVYSKRDTSGMRPADRPLPNGAVVVAGGARVRALHTPGHAPEHLCFLLESEDAVFTGDHVMGGSTVVIAPPRGDMAEYLAQLERLRDMSPSHLYPAHGPVIPDPEAELTRLLTHRGEREASIVKALAEGDTEIEQIVSRVYTDVPPVLHPVAAFTVLAHLQKLEDEGRVVGTPAAEAVAGELVPDNTELEGPVPVEIYAKWRLA